MTNTLSYRQDGEKGYFMLVYDVYIMRHGKNYYQKFRLRGSEERFASIDAILTIYVKLHVIDAYYMFELSPEDTEDAEDA